MKESAVEQYLRRQVRAHGGMAIKVAPVSMIGLPDRLVLLYGTTYWVEVKRPGERPRPEQVRRHRQLRMAGAKVIWLDSKEAIDRWISQVAGTKTEPTPTSV